MFYIDDLHFETFRGYCLIFPHQPAPPANKSIGGAYDPLFKQSI